MSSWGWLFSRRIDLFFFFFPVLLSIPIWFFAQSKFANTSVFWMVMAATGFGSGPVHASATWFTFFDRKNRAHYTSSWKHWLIYVFLPPIIVLMTVAGSLTLPVATLVIFVLWTIQHLTQQNVGILLLYHRRDCNEAIVSRRLEALSIQVPTFMFTLIMAKHDWLNNNPGPIFDGAIMACFAASLYFVGRYLYELHKEVRQGAILNLPALIFWATSVMMFWSLAYLPNGFLISLIWHWFQYIGLNLRMIKAKYGTDAISNLPEPHPFLLFFIIGTVFFLVYLGLPFVGALAPTLGPTVKGTLFGLGNAHYFLDAFLWRFRDPFPKENVLPYLRMARSASSAAAAAGS